MLSCTQIVVRLIETDRLRNDRLALEGQEESHETVQGSVMDSDAIIGLSVLLCFIGFSIVAGNYITPRLQGWSREDVIKALAAPHMFRFVFSCPVSCRQPCLQLLPIRRPTAIWLQQYLRW